MARSFIQESNTAQIAPLLDHSLELGDEFLKSLNRNILVENNVVLLLHLLDDGLEGVDIGLVDRLEAHHNVAVHLNETTIGIPCEVRIAGLLRKTLNNFIVKAEVEDGIHHTGHRSTGT